MNSEGLGSEPTTLEDAVCALANDSRHTRPREPHVRTLSEGRNARYPRCAIKQQSRRPSPCREHRVDPPQDGNSDDRGNRVKPCGKHKIIRLTATSQLAHRMLRATDSSGVNLSAVCDEGSTLAGVD
jgi:hypothetical protein